MSLFVTDLAYEDPTMVAHAKIGVPTSAVLCSVVAALVLTTGRPSDRYKLSTSVLFSALR